MKGLLVGLAVCCGLLTGLAYLIHGALGFIPTVGAFAVFVMALSIHQREDLVSGLRTWASAFLAWTAGLEVISVVLTATGLYGFAPAPSSFWNGVRETSIGVRGWLVVFGALAATLAATAYILLPRPVDQTASSK